MFRYFLVLILLFINIQTSKAFSENDFLLFYTINRYVNSEITYEKEKNGVDYWQLPSETWTLKKGDCEDFASLKAALLVEVFNVDSNRLKFLLLENQKTKSGHLVLLIDNSLVLDNSFDIVLLKEDYLTFTNLKELSTLKFHLYTFVRNLKL